MDVYQSEIYYVIMKSMVIMNEITEFITQATLGRNRDQYFGVSASWT